MCITVVPAGVLLGDRGQRATDLPSSRLPGPLPQINITVGVSDAGRDHGVTEAFTASVARFLDDDPPGAPDAALPGTG
ncbi:hypothetical protein AB0A91_17975 [Streptomyces sp. NPDC042207]|uniref:hypothetical protein n=1 Tax=Streptomyces sp. NPDC042207 TaxID=3154331 RepID=UPI0033FF1541